MSHEAGNAAEEAVGVSAARQWHPTKFESESTSPLSSARVETDLMFI